MDYILVTPIDSPRNRWQEAFPDGSIYARAEQLDNLTAGQRRIVWYDGSQLPASERFEQLGKVVALGGLVVVMAADPKEDEAYEALNSGAMGYCHLLAVPAQLKEIATVVEHGGVWVGPELMQRVLKMAVRVTPGEPNVEYALNELTSRELMVAREVGQGASNKEIAEHLEITERTVKAHLSAIFDKLGVRDRVQLALAINNIPTNTTIN